VVVLSEPCFQEQSCLHAHDELLLHAREWLAAGRLAGWRVNMLAH